MTFKTLKIPGASALDTLESYRKAFGTTGEYPFIIGDAVELGYLRGAAEHNDQTFESILNDSMKVDLEIWMAERRAYAEEDGFLDDELLGQWSGKSDNKESMALHLDFRSGLPKPEVILGLALIREPWHLPAVLKYGGWNECPFTEVHCAFHRYWQFRFGAEIVGMSGDVVECIVKHPPRDRDTAMELAWQQYWYCNDIVDQGCRTISNLAAALLNSQYWFFWWD